MKWKLAFANLLTEKIGFGSLALGIKNQMGMGLRFWQTKVRKRDLRNLLGWEMRFRPLNLPPCTPRALSRLMETIFQHTF